MSLDKYPTYFLEKTLKVLKKFLRKPKFSKIGSQGISGIAVENSGENRRKFKSSFYECVYFQIKTPK
jgi:hypothetical protein